MQALSPGTSPPPVRMPSRMIALLAKPDLRTRTRPAGLPRLLSRNRDRFSIVRPSGGMVPYQVSAAGHGKAPMGDVTVEEELLAANAAFYAAFNAKDAAAMDAVWSSRTDASCIHPGWNLLSGREAV